MPASLGYVGSRLLTTVLTVLGAMLLLFALTVLVPGDPAAILLGPQASPEAAARFVAEMGLDQPIPIRFLRFFGHLLTGDLGTDVLSGRRVLDTVVAVLPYTIILTFSAIALALLLGVPLGAYAATRPGSWADHALAGVSVAFIAIPSFVIAILLLLVFSVWLDWLPVLGTGRAGDWADQARRLILPTVALSVGWIGFIARLVRTSMLEVLNEPYIRTARAYGLSQARITYLYALKNAFIPPLAILGLGVGRLLGGAVLVEIVFARPGLGRLVLDAINGRNFPVLQGAVLVVVVLFVGTNLVVDLLYAALDPRMRRRS
ncbi:MAG: ABC transporter permease [Janthinobacterium lividum]